MTAGLEPIEVVNTAPVADLTRLIGPLFEDAGPLAARLDPLRPFASWFSLLDAAEAMIADMPGDERAELLRAHPRIGAAPAELARRSAQSFAEQGGEAGGADEAVNERLAALNDRYEDRFGFPFVVYVAGRPRSELVGVLTERLERTREAELTEGTDAMVAIARDRLSKMAAGQ
jgi:2-oxo-4-hydroxy-4-carboxy-5-ureidoimidazoline decarboxylase